MLRTTLLLAGAALVSAQVGLVSIQGLSKEASGMCLERAWTYYPL
jgi:hypothetical protein